MGSPLHLRGSDVPAVPNGDGRRPSLFHLVGEPRQIRLLRLSDVLRRNIFLVRRGGPFQYVHAGFEVCSQSKSKFKIGIRVSKCNDLLSSEFESEFEFQSS